MPAKGQLKYNITKEFLLEELKTKSPKQISIEVGCRKEYIARKIRELEIKRPKNQHLINGDYFKTWSCDMAYILGFIFADGCVYSNPKMNNRSYITVSLHRKDKDILEFISSKICPSLRILQHDKVDKKRDKVYKVATLSMCSKVMYQDLVNLGCLPNKSYEEIRVPDVPVEYIPDFIRGYFDGDGSVFYGYGKKEIKKLKTGASFSCSSVSFLNDIKEIINIGKIRTDYSPASLHFYSLPNYKILFNYMYNGNFHMKRKYDKFLKIFDLIGVK